MTRPWRSRPFRRIGLAAGAAVAAAAATPEGLQVQVQALRGDWR
jgi:hypothetical protein